MTFSLDDIVPESLKNQSATPALEWSDRQNAIFHNVTTTSENLSVEAVAGSGKTTTILECMRLLGAANVLFLAFNKSIQLELSARVPFGVTASTCNALGHNILLRRTNTRKLNKYKVLDIIRDVCDREFAQTYGWDMSKIVDNLRGNAVGIVTDMSEATLYRFVADSTIMIEPGDMQVFVRNLHTVFNKCIDDAADNFDFADQLYMPLFWDMTFPQYDVVFIDEAQDLSPIQHMQLAALAQRGARIIAVGDSYQAIYAFRGADIRSMARLREAFDATMLPLDVCYRCDRKIITKAQEIVPHIKWRPDAPEGKITEHEEYPQPEDYPQRSMIISRNNAPLMSLASDFLMAEVPCYVVMDFAQGLTKLIDKTGARTAKELEVRINRWADTEIERAEELGRTHLVASIEDKRDCILPFCDKYSHAIQIKQAIKRLTESDVGPRLSTVHKAKGLEADDTFILRPDLMPSHYALKASQEYGDDSLMIQEKNLMYVAWTRAKHHLHFLPHEER